MAQAIPNAACMAALLLLLVFSPGSSADVRTNANAWIDAYGLSEYSGALNTRVQSIFNRVKRVSGGSSNRSRLYIIESNTLPWAIALQDKNIILSRGSIDLIYGGEDSLAAKDARMAFVLGHELKHVIDNDFWHDNVYRNFSRNNSFKIQNKQIESRRRQDELRADEEGFIYASLAGFDTTAIFSEIGGHDNFLEFWVQQTNTVSGSGHFSAPQRTKFLHDRYNSLLNSVEFFKYGVRLAHFGRYKKALVLLDEFSKIYESREVLNNLGYVHIQLARASMSSSNAYRYWFPALLEPASGVPIRFDRNLNNKLNPDAIYHLEQAAAVLRKSIDLTDSNANGYRSSSAQVNLATALMYLEKFDVARAALSDIHHQSESADILNALIDVRDERITDPWSSASRKRLEALASHESASVHLLYNYARLLEDLDREYDAADYWTRLHKNLPGLPKAYQLMVCRELKIQPCTHQQLKSRTANLNWKIVPGYDVSSEEVRTVIKNWKKPIKENLDGIDAQIYRDHHGNSFLAMDNRVEIVSIRQHGYDFASHLQQAAGSATSVSRLGYTEIWSYDNNWSAVIDGNQVREVWIRESE